MAEGSGLCGAPTPPRYVEGGGEGLGYKVYRGTLLIRNCAPLGPYSRIMPRALWWLYGGGLFLMSEVPM